MVRPGDYLAKFTGAEFDREFRKNVGLEDHDDAIGRFSIASRSSQDPQLKAWIDSSLPVLRKHQSEARKLR